MVTLDLVLGNSNEICLHPGKENLVRVFCSQIKCSVPAFLFLLISLFFLKESTNSLKISIFILERGTTSQDMAVLLNIFFLTNFLFCFCRSGRVIC